MSVFSRRAPVLVKEHSFKSLTTRSAHATLYKTESVAPIKREDSMLLAPSALAPP